MFSNRRKASVSVLAGHGRRPTHDSVHRPTEEHLVLLLFVSVAAAGRGTHVVQRDNDHEFRLSVVECRTERELAVLELLRLSYSRQLLLDSGERKGTPHVTAV